MYFEERVFATYMVRWPSDSANPSDIRKGPARSNCSRCQAIHTGAVPQALFTLEPPSSPLAIGTAFVRIGEVEAAVRVADHVVGTIEAPALVVVDKRACDLDTSKTSSPLLRSTDYSLRDIGKSTDVRATL